MGVMAYHLVVHSQNAPVRAFWKSDDRASGQLSVLERYQA